MSNSLDPDQARRLIIRFCNITNSNLQFHGHHSLFRKDFQMLLTLKGGHTYNVASTACTRLQKITKQRVIISKSTKKLYCSLVYHQSVVVIVVVLRFRSIYGIETLSSGL